MKLEKLDVTRGNPLKVFLTFSIPSVIGLLSASSAETIDAIFVGNYAGSASLAAVNLVIPFFFFVFGFAVMIVTGSSVRCGKYMGEGNPKAASAIFTRTMIVLGACCVVITIAGTLFSRQIVAFLGANKELTEESALYLWTISLFTLFFLCSYGLSVFVRVDGRPVLSSVGMVIGSISNFVLDFWLIAVLDMGVKGAAIATGGAQIISFLILLFHFFTDKSSLKFELNWGRWGEIFKACYNGLSEFTNEMSAGIVVLIFNWIMISRMGVSGVAGYSVINYTLGIGIMVSYGFSDSLLPIVSTHLGAKMPERINRFLIISSILVFGLGLVLFTLLAFFPDHMIDVFLEPEELSAASIALEFIVLVKWSFLFIGINLILTAYHTAMHRPMESAIIALFRSLILPVSALLVLPKLLDNTGIYLVIPLSEFITLLIAVALFIRNRPSKLIARPVSTDILEKDHLRN